MNTKIVELLNKMEAKGIISSFRKEMLVKESSTLGSKEFLSNIANLLNDSPKSNIDSSIVALFNELSIAKGVVKNNPRNIEGKMVKGSSQTDQEYLNLNIKSILSSLRWYEFITVDQFENMSFLLKDVLDNNEDEIMTIISPIIDKLLVKENKQLLKDDRSELLDAISVVFPDKAKAWKELIKTDLLDSLNYSQKAKVSALLSEMLKLGESSSMSMPLAEYKSWKKLLDESNDSTIVETVESCLLSKFKTLDFDFLRKKAPNILGYMRTNYPTQFEKIKAQYIAKQ